MAEGRVVAQLFERSSKSCCGAVDEEACLTVAENLGDSADAGRDDGPAGGHRFDKDEREGLVLGEDDDEIETREASLKILDKTDETDGGGLSGGGDPAPQSGREGLIGLVGGTDNQKLERAVRLPGRGSRGPGLGKEFKGRFDKDMLSFEGRDLTNDSNGQGAGDPERLAGLRAVTGEIEVGVDPVGDDRDPRGQRGKRGKKAVTDRGRDGNEMLGAGKSPGEKRIAP